MKQHMGIFVLIFVLAACGTNQAEANGSVAEPSDEIDYDATMEALRENLETPTLTAEEHFLRANEYATQARLAEAIEEFSLAIELDENYQDAYALRGATHGMLREFDAGIEDLTEAITLDPENAEFYMIRGRLYFDKGFFEEDPGSSALAIEDLNKAVELDPQFAEAYYLRGQVNHEIGVYRPDLFLTNFLEDAIADFTKVIEIEPDNALAYYDRAIDYGLLRDERMIADLEMAIELGLDPERDQTARETLDFILNSE